MVSEVFWYFNVTPLLAGDLTGCDYFPACVQEGLNSCLSLMVYNHHLKLCDLQRVKSHKTFYFRKSKIKSLNTPTSNVRDHPLGYMQNMATILVRYFPFCFWKKCPETSDSTWGCRLCIHPTPYFHEHTWSTPTPSTAISLLHPVLPYTGDTQLLCCTSVVELNLSIIRMSWVKRPQVQKVLV